MTFPTRFPSDLQIARKAKLKPMEEIAAGIGVGPHARAAVRRKE